MNPLTGLHDLHTSDAKKFAVLHEKNASGVLILYTFISI